jgi:transcription antitermination factor NusG
MSGDLAKLYRERVGDQLQVGTIIGYDDADPRHAEMQLEPAVWRIVETLPSHERIAGAHLIARRFGIYVPEIEGVEVRRGRKRNFLRPMFPGYIFVFVWGIKAHISRIMNCPGVWKIMKNGSEYAALPDGAINEIRAVENSMRPIIQPLDAFAVFNGMRKQKRWRHAPRRPENQRVTDNEVVSVRSWSAFTDGLSSAVDGGERNRLLLKAFSLPS